MQDELDVVLTVEKVQVGDNPIMALNPCMSNLL